MKKQKTVSNLLKVLILLAFITACSKEKNTQFYVGNYRGLLINNSGIEIPFNFELKLQDNKPVIQIKNAEEIIEVTDFHTQGDSVRIVMPFFDAEFSVKVYEDSLKGYWIKHLADRNVYMPLIAIKDEPRRFTQEHDSLNNKFDGTWPTKFVSSDGKDTSVAIGEFVNKGKYLQGTFLSSTGDYRYLQGIAKGDSMYLSTFDGSHAYLFTGMRSGQTITGQFYAGLTSLENWEANYDLGATLPNADSLTFLADSYSSLNFSFPNIEGKNISIADPQYQNKVVVIQIMGSWCPNCMDESKYLTEFYSDYAGKGVEIIGLCYERSDVQSVATKNIKNMKDRLAIPYELLLAGTNKKGNVNESLPMLKNFVAFPTMIILDKKHTVRKIHTGYSGPATGKHYIEFKSEFESYIKSLLNE